jgi:hypothetical protein
MTDPEENIMAEPTTPTENTDDPAWTPSFYDDWDVDTTEWAD